MIQTNDGAKQPLQAIRAAPGIRQSRYRRIGRFMPIDRYNRKDGSWGRREGSRGVRVGLVRCGAREP